MREDRGERPGTKGLRGARPGRGAQGQRGKGGHRRGGSRGSAPFRPPAGRENCPGPCPRCLCLCLSAGPRRRTWRVGPASPGRRARKRSGPTPGSQERAGAAPSSRSRWPPPGEPTISPRTPVPISSDPGTWPKAGERGQAAAADDEVEREGTHAPAQAGQPGRKLLHGMGAPGPPSRGPDGQSRAAQALAPAATSRGRRGARRLAAPPGRGRHVAGLPAGRRPRPRPRAPPPPPGPPPPPLAALTQTGRRTHPWTSAPALSARPRPGPLSSEPGPRAPFWDPGSPAPRSVRPPPPPLPGPPPAAAAKPRLPSRKLPRAQVTAGDGGPQGGRPEGQRRPKRHLRSRRRLGLLLLAGCVPAPPLPLVPASWRPRPPRPVQLRRPKLEF